MDDLLTIKEASEFASQVAEKEVSVSNISYLIQYGRVKKVGYNGMTQIFKKDLMDYYNQNNNWRKQEWQKKLGNDLNWDLSFEQYKEAETTKHVHRLHPYKGKFIPQLVEYFLDGHTDNFKRDIYFQKGDIVLDPFCGSGTTLVQANELGIHSIGVDISSFNAFISNVKIWHYDFNVVKKEIDKITRGLVDFVRSSPAPLFENQLATELSKFNAKYFPSPEYRYKIRQGQIKEIEYGRNKEKEFLVFYNNLAKKHGIKLIQDCREGFLCKWYLEPVRKEIDFVFEMIKKIKNPKIKILVSVILSRTIRSCRATTHADLATLRDPIIVPYYCAKHGKICKPLFSLLSWWRTYTEDTIKRLSQFNSLRTDTHQICLIGDSRKIDIIRELEKTHSRLLDVLGERKISGIFSSPPYVGLIDYHEQHAYAYDLFSFERKDELEIGPLSRGQGMEARNSYAQGISDVLNNCKRFLEKDYNVFLVANDKYNLYPTIAKKSGMCIVNQYKRPVLNRTEKDKGAFCEIIFHLKEKNYGFIK